MFRRHPFLIYFVLTFGLSLVLAILIWQRVSTVDEIGAWFIAINIVSAVFYFYDKLISGSRATRVPEFDLFLLTMFGGWLGGGFIILTLRHKVSKPMFLAFFALGAAISVVLRDGYYQFVRPQLGG